MRRHDSLEVVGNVLLWCLIGSATAAPGQQPAKPIDVTPLDGEIYYVVNQLSGHQIDLNNDSTVIGDRIVQQSRSFTDLGQRWAFTKVSGGLWRISSIRNGLCFDTTPTVGETAPICPQPCGRVPGRLRDMAHGGHGFPIPYVVQRLCADGVTQQWTLIPATNGYHTIANESNGLALDLSDGSSAAGTQLLLTALSGSATQSQQWLLRPAFFRGIDNALLEKQEADRISAGVAWWQDAGLEQDVLQILKNHGINMVRLRPASVPPYANASAAGCSGNACYAETDAQDLDLAKRARNLGMSIELTLLFDGANSSSVPAAWANHTIIGLQSDIYDYVKAEILQYRQAGTVPDLVSIGNEVDTGFLGPIGSPTGANFGGFATLQIAAMQAVQDAAADTSAGPAIPAPLTCIHITPAWDLTQFFTLVNQYKIPYDAICQSYYPLYHGPLTVAQATAFNPGGKPVEQEVLVNAANNMGKPIFIIETGEHFDNGFDSNDPWYAPPTQALQRQFLLDLQSVQKALPDNLGMGMEYWDPAGVNTTKPGGGVYNGDNLPDAIYIWNGLTLFDDANPSMLLPAVDALGGKLDPTLSYKFVLSNGQILSVVGASNAAGARLDAGTDNGNPSLSQQWRIVSNDDGYFQIASLNPGTGGTTNVLDDSGGSVVQSPSGSGPQLEWDIVSAGDGYFRLVNRASGLALSENSGAEQWQIVPVH